MVNYNNKIEELKNRGIFSQEQAKKLSDSFKSSSKQEITIERKRYLDMVGLGLFGFILFYIIIAVSRSSQSNVVQDVSTTLNQTQAVATMPSVSSFMIILFVLLSGLYIVLYVLAHNRFNAFQKMDRDIHVQKASIQHALLMEKELVPKLEAYLSQHMDYKKELKEKSLDQFISVSIDDADTESQWLMNSYRELQCRLKEERDTLAFLEEECQSSRQIFPDNLAKLVGKLPICK